MRWTFRKKYELADVRQLAASYIKKYELDNTMPKSSDEWGNLMRIEINGFNYKNPIDNFKELLALHFNNIEFGNIWIPGTELSLSGEAGSAMRESLLNAKSKRDTDKSAVRKPLLELAHLILHRLTPMGSVQAILNNGCAETAMQVLGKSRRGRITSLGGLNNSRLL